MIPCCATEQWACSLEAALEAEAKAAKTTVAAARKLAAAPGKLDEDKSALSGKAELLGQLTGAQKVTRVTNHLVATSN